MLKKTQPTQMILDLEGYLQEIQKWLAQKPSHLLISTYNIWAGIPVLNGEQYDIKLANRITNLLTEIEQNVKNPTILVGLNPLYSCAGKRHCEDCWRSYKKRLQRASDLTKIWKKIKWRFGLEHHIKLALYADENGWWKGMVGSRNLSDSQYEDIMIYVDKEISEKLLRHMRKLWPRMTDNPLTILKQQEKLVEAKKERQFTIQSNFDGFNLLESEMEF